MNFDEWYIDSYPLESFEDDLERIQHKKIAYSGYTARQTKINDLIEKIEKGESSIEFILAELKQI